jgi:hypothetical protein
MQTTTLTDKVLGRILILAIIGIVSAIYWIAIGVIYLFNHISIL